MMLKDRFFLLLFFFTSLPCSAELNSFTARYEIHSMAMAKAIAVNSLRIQNNHYSYHSKISPSGWLSHFNSSSREESSQGIIENQQLSPVKYSYKLLRNEQLRRHVEIDFLSERNKIINHHRHIDNRWQMSWAEGVQDHLSYQLALMLKLQNSIASDKRPDFFFSVADGGRLKKYTFKVLGEENLETPIGLLNTLKLEHKAYNQNDTITIWCAADLAYLPVKIVQEKSHSPDYRSVIISYHREPETNKGNSPLPTPTKP